MMLKYGGGAISLYNFNINRQYFTQTTYISRMAEGMFVRFQYIIEKSV